MGFLTSCLDFYGEKFMSIFENKMVKQITIGSKKIILVGTAHVSRESADLTEEVLRTIQPDTVSIELCQSRYHILENPEKWRQTDLAKVIREKKATLLFVNLLLSSFQRRIAKNLGIRPGEEMVRAIGIAKELNIEVSLADRDIRTTLARSWRSISFWKKITLLSSFIFSFGNSEELTEEEIEKMKNTDVLESLLADVGKTHPDLKRTLIDERDQYLSQKIKSAPGKIVVAIIGAGHLAGVLENIERDIDFTSLETTPSPSKIKKTLKWGIPGIIFALFVVGFFMGGSHVGKEMLMWWILANGVLASLGALIALAHPLTILAAFVAAPITSLNPMVAAGWISGLVEVSIRKPQVKDLDTLQDDILTIGFWRNRVIRVLLVVILTNLGSSIGTFVALPFMLKAIT